MGPSEHFKMNIYVLLSLRANAGVTAAWTEGEIMNETDDLLYFLYPPDRKEGSF